jgi:hypothetical protein
MIVNRREERKKCRLKANFVSSNMKYLGFTENLSEHGICITAAPTKSAIDFTSQISNEVHVELPSRETVTVSGGVIWVQTDTSPHGYIFKMGMRLVNAPREYTEFIKELN